MSDERLRVILGWHMHQPEYRDPSTGQFRLPWTYLHAIKDYSDMAAHLEAAPAARAVVNFAPLLLEQLEAYVEQIDAYFAHHKPLGDRVLAALVAERYPTDADARRDLVEAALRAHPQRLIARFSTYRLLASEGERLRTRPEELEAAPEGYLADLLTWFHLAWMGESLRRELPLIGQLQAQQRMFTLAQRRELLACIGDVIRGLVPRYRALATSGRVELSVTPYGHPILPLLLDFRSHLQVHPEAPLPAAERYPGGADRARWHLRQAIKVFEATFGMRPAGCWCSEGAISAETLPLLDELEFAWTASAQRVLARSAGEGHIAPVDRSWQLSGTKVRCFFREDDLSDRIGFSYENRAPGEAVDDLLTALVRIADYGPTRDRVVTIFLDGENAWEYYPENGWNFLTELYRRLSQHPRLRMTTFSEALAEGIEPEPLARLTAGSWVDGALSTWIGQRDKNRAWDQLVEAKNAFDRATAGGKRNAEALARAERQLAVCEGSDWFWWLGSDSPAAVTAEFDRLFRGQLFRLYQMLRLKPPKSLTEALSEGGDDSATGGVMKPSSEDSSAVPQPGPARIAPREGPLDRRRAGVLLHITSLPGSPGNGDFSHGAYRFIEFAAKAGFGVWQILPMGATHEDGSPYLALSANAGNPLFISLDWLVDRGWLDGYDASAEDTRAMRRAALRRAREGFETRAGHDWHRRLAAFCAGQSDWIDDFAMFGAINDSQGGRQWIDWPEGLRDRDPQALAGAANILADDIAQLKFEQFLFYTQWDELRLYADAHGLQLFGDLPLFVAHHSVDVWAHRELFHVGADGAALKIAGVPPDYFAKDGQVWGNPLYNWEAHAAEGFRWWLRRMRTQSTLYDLVRIDHFRGLRAYWELDGGSETARNGRWVQAPGDELLRALTTQLYPLPLVAEDLGEITPDVYALRDRFKMPGMRVLQFAYDGDPRNVHLPWEYTIPLVAYTGTHDNATTLEWWQSQEPETREAASYLFMHSGEPMPWPAIHTVYASTAPLAMIPMQDLLALGAEGRMNVPGTAKGNWSWRFDWSQVPAGLIDRLRDMHQRYGRTPRKAGKTEQARE